MVQIKIYPSKHKIQLVNESRFDTDLNIPLSYINLDYTKYEIDKIIEQDFLKSDSNKNIQMTPILPRQQITDINKFVFNKFEESVDAKKLYQKIGSKYYYVPPYEFIPNKFSYEVIVKKNMVYNSSRVYNINVACFDTSDNLALCSRLSTIFTSPSESSNPNEASLMLSNIKINGNKKSLSAFTDMSYEEADFLFVQTYDGLYIDESYETEARINDFLDNNINVWVGCDDHWYYREKNDDLGYLSFHSAGAFKEFELKRTNLSKNKLVYCDNYFNLNRPMFQSIPSKRFYNLFTGSLSPVLIIEHVGKGFEIISHNEVLNDPEKHKDLIYEVMMYVYLLSYKRSKRVDEWITYTCPDYEVINDKLYEKTNFSSHTSLSELFDLSPEDYSLFQINTYDNNKELPLPDEDLVSTVDNITYTAVKNNRIVFKMGEKDAGSNVYTEVDKPVGWVSIYKDGKIYYTDQLLYYIESDITNKLFVIEEDNSLIIKLYPFKSSKHNLDLKVDCTATIKEIKTDVNGIMRIINELYTIFYNKETSKLEYVFKEKFVEDENKVKIFDLNIYQSVDNVFLTDMRQLGGGLRKDAKDDYDLLDIGHINGRPYRQGNTLIITMPKKYEPYKDRILEALEKYKVGEDYPVIFFEDKE